MHPEKINLRKMNFIDTIWLFFQNWILPFFYISSSHDSNNKRCDGPKDGGSVSGEEDLPEGLRQELMPRHVAVVMDGNRRWANSRGLSYVEGYEAGVGAMGDFMNMCTKFKIPVVSLFAFSSENWLRPKDEVDFLMGLFEKSLKDNLGPTVSRGGRVTVIGDTSQFPISLQKVIKELEESTKDNTTLHLILAMSYSGQYDIVQACQSIANKVKDGLIDPKDVTKSSIERELETKIISDVPSPDLLIRTSGEFRLSNFYLWQSAYTEMYFTDTHWPDFGEDDFVDALRSYLRRGRRFGSK